MKICRFIANVKLGDRKLLIDVINNPSSRLEKNNNPSANLKLSMKSSNTSDKKAKAFGTSRHIHALNSRFLGLLFFLFTIIGSSYRFKLYFECFSSFNQGPFIL